MRLVQRNENNSLSLTDDLPDHNIPKYVILSHTWGAAGEEVSFQDFESGSAERLTRKIGYEKIQFCAKQAARDGYQYFWVDTCCIDKTNLVELSEAINSMFRWYRQAVCCYVYLSDVEVTNTQSNAWRDDFRKSRWFTRGWTLQELIAPRSVEFFSVDGTRLGDKVSLEDEIHEITGIAIAALRGGPLADFSVSERMGWASKRQTTRKEDEAYSLLGLFDLHMPLIYGEREKALRRLHKEIEMSLRVPHTGPDYSINASDTLTRNSHPVQHNYRRVHVTVLYWEMDDQVELVQRITRVFHSLYRYDVLCISLPHVQEKGPMWPWTDAAFVDERDLQIIFYLGSTCPLSDNGVPPDLVGVKACPVKEMPPDEGYPKPQECAEGHILNGHRYPWDSWLSPMLQFPNLVSDALVILDCFNEGLLHGDSKKIAFLQDSDYSWARYCVLLANYHEPPAQAGKLANTLMSILEELAVSNRFYARAGLITTRTIQEKLEGELRFDKELQPVWVGSDAGDFIHVAPLPVSAT